MNDIQILLPHLLSPENKRELVYDENAQTLSDHFTGKKYMIRDSIPLLLPEKEKEGLKTPDIFQKYHTAFSYIDHYNKDAELFCYQDIHLNLSNLHENKRLHQTIIRQIPRDAGFILDAGCGDGWLASQLKSTGRKLCSMDVSTANPFNAVKKYPFQGHGAIVADVYHLPFRENTFDCIVACEIMEHTADPAMFIKELVKVLKPGGKLIITTPYNEKMEYTLCVHCNKPTPVCAHLHSFNEGNILPVLASIEGSRSAIRLFSSRTLIMLKSYILLQYLGFSIWKATDRLFNLVLKNPTRLMILVEKQF